MYDPFPEKARASPKKPNFPAPRFFRNFPVSAFDYSGEGVTLILLTDLTK
jgi:hypothetical protein